MNLPRNCIATKALLFALLLFAATLARAGEMAGIVTHLSGPLLAKKADGTVKILAQKSTVEQGDTLVSEKNTYARIKFTDNSEITLRPDSQLKIDSFSFDEAKPENDNAAFELIKGGLRAITGILGKRNKERVSMRTPTATIGIRGTTYIAEYIPVLPVAGERAPGLYVQVLDGMINLSNSGGSQNFAAGQFGFTPSFNQPPVILPANPGIKFTPPPAFSPATASNGDTSGTSPNDLNCEVR